MAASSSKDDGSQLQIRFITKQEQYVYFLLYIFHLKFCFDNLTFITNSRSTIINPPYFNIFLCFNLFNGLLLIHILQRSTNLFKLM